MAKFRPAARFPVIDEADLAHKGLEALGLAQRRVCGSPKLSTTADSSSFGRVLKGPERSVGSPDVEIDPFETCTAQDGLRRSRFRWCAAQEANGFLYRSWREAPRARPCRKRQYLLQ